MRTQVDLEVERPDVIKRVLAPSLTSDERVNYSLEADDSELSISVETEGLGPLRGCTDTVFRLSSLATRIYTN